MQGIQHYYKYSIKFYSQWPFQGSIRRKVKKLKRKTKRRDRDYDQGQKLWFETLRDFDTQRQSQILEWEDGMLPQNRRTISLLVLTSPAPTIPWRVLNLIRTLRLFFTNFHYRSRFFFFLLQMSLIPTVAGVGRYLSLIPIKFWYDYLKKWNYNL